MSQSIVSPSKQKIKTSQKNFENQSVEMKYYKSKFSIFWMKGKIDPETSYNPYRNSYEKIVRKQRQQGLKRKDFTYSYMKPFS